LPVVLSQFHLHMNTHFVLKESFDPMSDGEYSALDVYLAREAAVNNWINDVLGVTLRRGLNFFFFNFPFSKFNF
jgi:hypothetical protein